MSMTKTQAKEKAKTILQSAIGNAYYKLENEDLTSKDEVLVLEYINKLATKACKSIGTEYISY